MADAQDHLIANDDALTDNQKAILISQHEHHKAQKEVAEEAKQAEKDEATRQEYEEVHGHEPIDPLSF